MNLNEAESNSNLALATHGANNDSNEQPVKLFGG